MKYTIKNEEILEINETVIFEFPKYTSQLINNANQNAQATRPRAVGQLSELFPEFLNECNDITIENWKNWYLDKYPDAIDEATRKINDQMTKLKGAIKEVDVTLIRNWVEDLIFNKTFNGMYFQKAILVFLSDKENLPYRLATPEEESIGIDGFIGDTPYSIKPETYKTMDRLSETIDVKIIYYEKTKTSLIITVEN